MVQAKIACTALLIEKTMSRNSMFGISVACGCQAVYILYCMLYMLINYKYISILLQIICSERPISLS